MDGIIKLSVLIISMFYHASSFTDTDLNGIIFTAITVDDFAKEEEFYIDILGGMKVDKLSTDGLYGDSLFYSMYQSEYEKYKVALAAGEIEKLDLEYYGICDVKDDGNQKNCVREHKKPKAAGEAVGFEYYGICDIRDRGSQKIAWSMIMLDSSMVMLMQCRERNDKNTPVIFRRPNRGSAKIGVGAHICTWGRDDIVPLQQIGDIKDLEEAYKMPHVGFVTLTNVKSEKERSQLPNIDFLLQVGFNFAATRGASTEKVEISYRVGDGMTEHLKYYCEHKGVSTLMFRPQQDTKYEQKINQKMAGLHHTSITVRNKEETLAFYTDILGGKLSQEFTLAAGSPGWYEIIFQDDYLEARNNSINDNRQDYAKYGILKNLDVSGSGATVTVGFILFDNTFFEYYAFEDEASLMALTETEERYLGPGYSRSFVNGFMVKEDVDINSFIYDMEEKAAQKGLSQVKANRAVDGTNAQLEDYTKPLTENDLEGMNFVFFKGPSDETEAIVQFKGKARDALKEALLEYGGVSTAFDVTNPNTYGGFDAYCASINPPSCDCSNVPGLRPMFNIFLMIMIIFLMRFLMF